MRVSFSGNFIILLNLLISGFHIAFQYNSPISNLDNSKRTVVLFTFIDLFAGIGGIRFAFESVNGKCVFASEYDQNAQKTYQVFFTNAPDFSEFTPPLDINPSGDIMQFPPERVPDHDILTGGFPCQPFSLAGVSKKQSLGNPHGLDDPTQGTLFFKIKEIIKAKRPKAFMLENVKNLLSHDEKRTFTIIKDVLERELKYKIFWRIIDAVGWLPQHRERVYILGFQTFDGDTRWEGDSFDEFMQLVPPPKRIVTLDQILEKYVPARYTLGEKTWDTLIRHKKHHESIGQGFGYGLISPPFAERVTRTLCARYYKDGAEILIEQAGRRPRRLTPLECCKLMGFPERVWKYYEHSGTADQPVSDTEAYHQFGNSVAVPVVTAVATVLINKLKEKGYLR